MKIELKNLKINLAFSEETVMFKADVYVNGVKAMYAHNDGRGGETDYYPYEGKAVLMHDAEVWAKSLPPKVTEWDSTLDMNLVFLIDTMVCDESNRREREKLAKKIAKLCLTNIVYGVPESGSYGYTGFKANYLLTDVVKTEKGRIALDKMIADVKAKLTEGEVIFNTNI